MSVTKGNDIVQELEEFSSTLAGHVDMCSGSPDMAQLNKHEAHMLFVYNAFQRGFHGHSIFQRYQTERISGGYTSLKNFKMYQYENLSKKQNCIAFYEATSKDAGHLYGELWLVEPSLISQLDYQLGNRDTVKRFKTLINFHNPNNSAQALSVSAFIYLGKKDSWDEKADKMRLCDRKYFHNKPDMKFYGFTERRDNRR